MQFPDIHRVVTGHDMDGKAVVISNGELPTSVELTAAPGTVFHEVWSTHSTPAAVDNGDDPTIGPLKLSPPENGTRIRFVDIPPETAEYRGSDASKLKDVFSQAGDEGASTGGSNSPHPLMHRTESVDYGIVMEGEVTLVLDDSEVSLRPGSVVVQRGTNHAWANRSGKMCRMAFVLVGGTYASDIAAALKHREY